MKIRKSKKVIGTTKFSPPVGFQIAPSAPAGGGTNVAAMRPTFSFLAANADEINKRIYEGKLAWRAANPSLPENQFPGIPSLYGGGGKMGAGTDANRPPGLPVDGCPGGQRYRSDNQRCECPGATYWCDKTSTCVDWIQANVRCKI